jgi:hypothetical protein
MDEPTKFRGNTVDIFNSEGEVKHIKLSKFDAMNGWDLKRQFREYIESTSPEFRNRFTMTILSYASLIETEDSLIQLSSFDIANTVLESWMNVEIVFDAVLDYNNIDRTFTVERNKQWHFAGQEMATAFIAASAYLMKPAIEGFGEGQIKDGA